MSPHLTHQVLEVASEAPQVPTFGNVFDLISSSALVQLILLQPYCLSCCADVSGLFPHLHLLLPMPRTLISQITT